MSTQKFQAGEIDISAGLAALGCPATRSRGARGQRLAWQTGPMLLSHRSAPRR
jgi:hypothetical protein